MEELQKTTSILEPIFVLGLKQVINEVTSGKLKLKYQQTNNDKREN